MFNESLTALIYIGLGLMGSTSHWLKKRYIDLTTNDSLPHYLLSNLPTTVYTLAALVMAEINLAILQTGTAMGLANIIGAITLGFVTDSSINKSSEALVIKETVALIKEGVIPIPDSNSN